jgi:hypothetical protein
VARQSSITEGKKASSPARKVTEGGREQGREEGREEGREGGREGGRNQEGQE